MKRSLLICAPLAIALAAACGGSDMATQPPATAALKLASNATRGNILVDGKGATLYWFAKDLPAGGGNAAVSNCTGSASDANSCVHYWPIFYVSNPTLGPGLSAGDFGQIMRADGLPQTTYKGFPLYYFLNDPNPGDVNGETIPDWYVIRNPFYDVIPLHGTSVFLTDGKGRSLYYFLADTVGTPPTSACAGTAGDPTTCVGDWPIFFAGNNPVVPSGLDATKLTSFTRADNLPQSAYNGHPLYYFVNDAVPGDLKGLTFGPGLGFWFTVDPTQN